MNYRSYDADQEYLLPADLREVIPEGDLVYNEFYRIAFRKKIYNTLYELQADLDIWFKHYNEERTHSGKYCFGRTPMQTFKDSIPLVREKMLNKNLQTETT